MNYLQAIILSPFWGVYDCCPEWMLVPGVNPWEVGGSIGIDLQTGVVHTPLE